MRRAEAEGHGRCRCRRLGEADGGGGLADGVAQQVGVDAGRRGLVVLAGGVQADDGVEVDDAAGLVFGHLDEPDADQGDRAFWVMPRQAGQVAGQVGDEPAPQVARVGVEQHGGGVVVAVAAHRLAEPGVVLDVAGRAGDVAAVRAAPGVGVAAGAAGQHGLAAHPAGVDRAERRRGEGGEHARVRGDRLGDALAAGQAGADELPGVALVDRRAGRADGLAAVAARDVQHSPVLGGGVVDRGEFAGGQVDGVDAAAQPDRVRAVRRRWRAGVPRRGSRPRRWSGVVGGRPRSRARMMGSGSQGGCRGGHEARPQRCWAAWRVMPSREPISAQE